jgi:hypothetical protein
MSPAIEASQKIRILLKLRFLSFLIIAMEQEVTQEVLTDPKSHWFLFTYSRNSVRIRIVTAQKNYEFLVAFR